MITKMNAFGYTVFEPMTAFTDFLLAGICIYFYLRYFQSSNSAVKDWGKFFLFMSVSTFIGGITHAFFEEHSLVSYKAFWLCMQIFSGLSLVYAQLASSKMLLSSGTINENIFQKHEFFYWIQFVVFSLAVFALHNFTVVVINSTFGFLTILFSQLFLALKFKEASAEWIAKGIIVSFLTAFIFIAKISVSEWFNFRDIAHVIMMISVCLVNYGVRVLQIRPIVNY